MEFTDVVELPRVDAEMAMLLQFIVFSCQHFWEDWTIRIFFALLCSSIQNGRNSQTRAEMLDECQEWWHGPVIGWTAEPGATPLADKNDASETRCVSQMPSWTSERSKCKIFQKTFDDGSSFPVCLYLFIPRPLHWKEFGWGLALKLRVSWESRKLPRPDQEQRKRERSDRVNGDGFDSGQSGSDFSVSPRPIRSARSASRQRKQSRCIVCHDSSQRRAKLLPCGHTFCRHCTLASLEKHFEFDLRQILTCFVYFTWLYYNQYWSWLIACLEVNFQL